MSRPRKPFGTSQPGRLPATMMKVLAAEMSDPTRHRRGKQYASDGSVLDIIIEPGVVTCEIQGSRSMPYVATVEVTGGSGMPLRRDITCTCSCPDDDNWDGHACKHVVATLYTLSNEFLIEPELLDVWRGNDTGTGTGTGSGSGSGTGSGSEPDSDQDAAGDIDETPTRGTRRHLSLVRDEPNEIERAVPEPRVVEDSLRPVLLLQPGTELPEVPTLERADLRPPKDRDLAAVLRDAMQHVQVDWD
jgi:uncharacterized Zn finger protein